MRWSIGHENGENVKVSFHFVLVLAASQFLMLLFAPSVLHNSSTNSNSTAKEAPMSTRATGTFEVKLEPLPTNDSSERSPVGRMSIDKQIHGDFEGTGKGEMLTAATSVKGSGAYVAIERVTGSLHGRSGSFVLQHIGHDDPWSSPTIHYRCSGLWHRTTYRHHGKVPGHHCGRQAFLRIRLFDP